MIDLNKIWNGADRGLAFIQSVILEEFPNDHLIGVEMGIAYGGGVESLGKLWGVRGTVYGFDTFEGHPVYLASSPEASEARAMEPHYKKYGMEMLSYEYQRAELDRQGLSNVILVKGLVDQDSCCFLPAIHYCFLDLDILVSMKNGYEAVRHKIVDGGYLCLHDVLNNLPILYPWYEEIKKDPMWEVIYEGKHEALAVLRRRR